MRSHTPALDYRPDIDGLRAFAVLSVVAFHAFPHSLKGGFIGVDVFFVISGFLISSIILRDLNEGHFSFLSFYSRRIRRIFPALALVLLFCLSFGWFALSAVEYSSLGKHVGSGAAFAANFALWREAGYFDVTAKAKPLLHLWSLGIEEQFYIFFPLAVWVAAKRRWPYLAVIAGLLALSFADNLALYRGDRVADFYSPLSRVWELLIGAVLASWKLRPTHQCGAEPGAKSRLALAFCGLAFLAAALIFAREDLPYPGWKALLPTLGAASLIAAGPGNPVNRLVLANPCAVFIGKISYPLYLWHWPLISYAFIIKGGLDQDTRPVRAALVALAFVLSTLTYFFVEKPIRFSKKFQTEKTWALVLIMLVLGCSGFTIYKNGGMAKRYNEPEYIARIWAKKIEAAARCTAALPEWKNANQTDSELHAPAPCKFSRDEANNTVAIIGDSHAEHLFAGLIADEKRDPGVIVFSSSCAIPFLDITRIDPNDPTKKDTPPDIPLEQWLQYIISHDNIKTVIISCNPYCFFFNIADNENHGIQDRDRIMENGMRKTFELLKKHHKRLIVVMDIPRVPFNINKCVQRNLPFLPDNTTCKFSRDVHSMNIALYWYRNSVAKLVNDYNLEVIDLANALCDQKECHLSDSNKLFYRDSDHLSIDGSIRTAELIYQALEKPVK